MNSSLQLQIKGQVITPADPEYAAARKVWNGMTDKTPRLIVKCADVADVVAAVKYARRQRLKITVRGGGHDIASSTLSGDGLVIDLSLMRSVTVDPARKIARVGGGSTWADVDAQTQKFSLATPGGMVSDTGVGGLTLGGGLGWLRRKYGLSCDNVISAQVVTVDGTVKTASEKAEPELFWALRGGGGGFGVVTEFEFKMHPVGSDVYVMYMAYPVEAAKEGLPFLEEQLKKMPDEVSSFAWLVRESVTFPPQMRGKDCFVIIAVYSDDPRTGEKVTAPLRMPAKPLFDLSGVTTYVKLQHLFDADFPVGRRHYWKSVYFENVTKVADVLDQSAQHRVSSASTLDIWHMGGAIARVREGETAYANRQAQYLLRIAANWTKKEEDAANIAWARSIFQEMRTFTSGQQYHNFPGFMEEKLEHVTPSEIVSRLSQIKAAYDPSGLFV